MVVALRSSFHRSRAILMLFIRIGLVVGAPSSSVVESGLCAGATAIEFQFVHVPKSGGKTLECTFEEGYRRRLIPCRVLGQTRVPVRIDGRHRTLAELELTRSAVNASTCYPGVTMLAHPVRRFLSAFNHRPAQATVGRLMRQPDGRFAVKTPRNQRTCNFLACRPQSDLMMQYDRGQMTANAYALWPVARDVEFGHK